MEKNRDHKNTGSGGFFTAVKTCIAAGLSLLFMAAAFNGVFTPQTAPIKSERPRVVYTLPRRKARDDFNPRANGVEDPLGAMTAVHYAPGATASILSAAQGVLLHPDLIARMDRDATVRQYVQWTFDAAARHGIDGRMLANQFWQESKFDAQAESGHGALGIAQIMQVHRGKLVGLHNRADFLNAKKSIDAGAELMGRLTREYGDQSLALVAYNGGGKAISFVEGKVGHTVTIGEWMSHMAKMREKQGTSNHSAWHVQTYHYVRQIDPVFWPKVLLVRAEQAAQRLAEETVQNVRPAMPAKKDAGLFSPAPLSKAA